MPKKKKKTETNDTFKNINLNLASAEKDISREASEQIITQKILFGTLPLTDDLRKQAKKAVLARFDGNKKEHDDKVKRLDRFERMYRGEDISADVDTKARISPMDAFNLVEDWTALIMDSLLGLDRPFDVKGRRKIVSKEQLRVIRKVLEQNMQEACGIGSDKKPFEEEGEKCFREMLKGGTLTAKTPYVIEEETRLRVKTEEIEERNVQGEVVSSFTKKGMEEVIETEDRPGFYYVDPRKLYYRAKSPSWFIELVDSTWSHVLRQADKKLYDNIEKARKTNYPAIGEKPADTKDKITSTDYDEMVETDGDIELMEAHHIPLRIKGKKILCLVVMANRSEVIRVQPTPFKVPPYIVHAFIPQPGSVDGIGLLQLVELLYKELTSRRRLSLDANRFGLYCMIAANMKYIKKKQQLKIRQNGVVELKEVDRPIDEIIKFIRPPVEYVTTAQGLMQDVQSDIVRTSRLKGVMAGEKIRPTPSATEMQSMIKEAYKSVKIIFRRISRNVIAEWLQRAYVMDILNREKSWEIQWEMARFDPETRNVITEESWVEVTPQQIYTDGIDIRILGLAHMENDIVTRHQKLQKFELMAEHADAPFIDERGRPVKLNLYKGFMDVLRTFGEDRPEENFMEAPAPPAPAMGPAPGAPSPGGGGRVVPAPGGTVAPGTRTLATVPGKAAGEGPLGGLG